MGQGQDLNSGFHSLVQLSLPHGTFASPQRSNDGDIVVVIMITIPFNKCLLTYLLTAMTIPTVAPRATNTQWGCYPDPGAACAVGPSGSCRVKCYGWCWV